MANKRIIEKLVKKDYNDDLEEILSSKTYKEDVKNLLLDILYRLDDSYKDYKKVKPDSLSKDEYIINLINTVKNDCDTIECVRPNSKSEKKCIVDKQNKKIVSYPILVDLLNALSEIRKGESIIKDEDELLIITLSDLIKIGNNINTVEPLRDFNGFSWNTVSCDIQNNYYNIIYQDLIILVGNRFLEEWANVSKPQIDYMEQLKLLIKNKYGKKLSDDIISLIRKLSILIEIETNEEFVEKIKNEKSKIERELKKYQSGEKLIADVTKRKKDILKQIKDIDLLINNKKLLQREYRKRNSVLDDKNKIFSVKVLAKQLTEERKKLMRKLDGYNDLLNPKKIIERKQKLQTKLENRKLIDIDNITDEIWKDIVLLQQMVIKCIETKIKKCNVKHNLMKIMYELRYFCMLPIKNNKKLDDIIDLKKDLNRLKQVFALKANQLQIMNKIFENKKLNNAVYSHIFSSSIISIDDISLKITKAKNEWYIQFFDEGTIDKKYKIGMDIKYDDIRIKTNKIVRLFDNNK